MLLQWEIRRIARYVLTMLGCACLLVATACSTSHGGGPAGPGPAPGAADGIGANGLPSLPPPSQLAASSAAAAFDDPTSATLSGSEFSPELPNHRVAVDDFMAEFSPAYSLEAGSADKDPAYACYRFNIPQYADAFPKLVLNWRNQIPGESGTDPAYAGLANLLADRWDWYEIQHSGEDEPNLIFMGNTGYIEPASLAPYFSSAGDLVLAVVVLGTSEQSLWILHAGTNYPPDGQLQANPGSQPLSVDLTAAVQDGDGTIAQAQWDFESDGVIDAAGPLSITHIYPAPGTYDVTFTAVDNNGASASFYLTVVATRWAALPLPEPIYGAYDADMVLSAAGQPQLAVSSSSLGLVYMTQADGAWQTETTGVETTSYYKVALAVSAAGEPQIVARGYDSDLEAYRVVHAYRQAGSWVTESLPWDAEQLEAGFDAQQRLHAAWLSTDTVTATQTVHHALWDGAGWTEPQEVAVNRSTSSGMAMVLDDQSHAHIALTALSGEVQLLLYVTATDAAIYVDNSTPLEDPSSQVYDMALDAQGNPHVLLGGTSAHYAMRAGGTWQVIGLTSRGDTGVLAIDSGYNITVALGWVPMDWGMPEGASSLRHTEGGWTRDELFNTGTVMYAMELDPAERPVLLLNNTNTGLRLMTLAP